METLVTVFFPKRKLLDFTFSTDILFDNVAQIQNWKNNQSYSQDTSGCIEKWPGYISGSGLFSKVKFKRSKKEKQCWGKVDQNCLMKAILQLY